MVSQRSVDIAIDNGLMTVTLNRPAVLNSLTPTMVEELIAILDRANEDVAVRALLMTGAGRGFCAGIDLVEGMGTPGEVDAGLVLETHLNDLLTRLLDLRVSIVVAVNGAAAGAGCSLALAGDIVIAADTAYFLQAFVNIGLVPDMGATWMLPQLVGRARAMAMMLLGERIGAVQAADWGLIHRATSPDMLMEQATALARRLAEGPTKALGLIRRTVQASLSSDLDTILRLERDNQRDAGFTADFVEGVAAFGERRPARFTGR